MKEINCILGENDYLKIGKDSSCKKDNILISVKEVGKTEGIVYFDKNKIDELIKELIYLKGEL